MSTTLTDAAYATMIEEDIAAIPKSMPALEREHTIAVLRDAVRAKQRERELAAQRQAREKAEAERDLAIAHDRQPYPTAHAYEQVCKARDKWQERAEKAEAELAAVREDAERYRWLRDKRDYAVICQRPGEIYLKLPRELDAAIDAARKP